MNRVHDKDEISSEDPQPNNERIQPAAVAPVHQSAPRQASPVGQERYGGPPQGQNRYVTTYFTLSKYVNLILFLCFLVVFFYSEYYNLKTLIGLLRH